MTTIIISNQEMDGIITIIKFLKELGLLISRVTEIIENEAKDQKGGFSASC